MHYILSLPPSPTMSGISAGFRALPLPIAQLSLATVLKCGQSFRWSIFPLPVQTASNALPSSQDFPTHEYRLCLRDRVVCLQQTSDTLLYRAVFPEPPRSSEEDVMREAQTLSWIRDYFQLNVDLLKLYDEWSHSDKVFERLKDRFSGIRMLRQDPWENLVSSVCSLARGNLTYSADVCVFKIYMFFQQPYIAHNQHGEVALQTVLSATPTIGPTRVNSRTCRLASLAITRSFTSLYNPSRTRRKLPPIS